MRMFFFCLTLIASTMFCHAQVSYGKYVRFPDNQLTGLDWKPQINFTRVDDADLISVRMCANDTYYSYDEDSRVLIRFEDSTVYKLPIAPIEVQQEYTNSVVYSSIISHYITYAFYSVSEEVVNKIVNDKMEIVKIRLAFANGSVRDYDIKNNYRKKLLNGLIESREGAISTNELRKRNMTDEGF